MSKKPLVAIRCITYNHEAYIRDALEGFVMQQTDFPFVAIVHDDASTDGTADIIREYAAKYPDIIKPIYETENQYSKRDGSIPRIMNEACEKTGAKYYALCEGDDYWTDPLKLQKQVDFLESHPDYSLVFANVRLHYDAGLSDDTFQLEGREYQPIEPYTKQVIPTPTVVFRREVICSDEYNKLLKIKKPVMGDLTLFMAATIIGKLRGMTDIVCGYRRLQTGATYTLYKNPYRWFKNRRDIADTLKLGREFEMIDSHRFAHYFTWAILHPFKNFPDNIFFAIHLFQLNPLSCIEQVGIKIKILCNRLF